MYKGFSFIVCLTIVTLILNATIIDKKYGRPALRIRRHERCSQELEHYSNHLTFLIRCVKNRIVPRDLRVRLTEAAKALAEYYKLAYFRLLRERIRPTQRAKGDAKTATELTKEKITSALSSKDASHILEKDSCNTERVFNKTKDQQQRKFDKLLQEETALFRRPIHLVLTIMYGLLIYPQGP